MEQKPHVQTKLDNLLVLQSLFKCRNFLCFSEYFPLSGFYTGVTVNLTQDDVVLNSVVKSECDKHTGGNNTAKGELFAMIWFTSAQAGGTLFSFLC